MFDSTFEALSGLRVDHIVRASVTGRRGPKLPFRVVSIRRGVDANGEVDVSPDAVENAIRVTGRYDAEPGKVVEVHWFAVRGGLATQSVSRR